MSFVFVFTGMEYISFSTIIIALKGYSKNIGKCEKFFF